MIRPGEAAMDRTTPAGAPSESAVRVVESRHLYPAYRRPDLVLERGSGWTLWDSQGREYVDLLGGIAVNALGHGHARIAEAIADQARRLIHGSNLFRHPLQGALAERLARLSGLPRVFFCNSGSEAVEAGIKVARALARTRGETERTGLVALEGSFHGRTAGALSVTGEASYRAPFEPLLQGVRFVPPEDETALREAIGRGTAAVLIEPIQGEGGVRCLSASYLAAARQACDAAGALLLLDEVQCGLGRAGSWFAYQDAGVLPDLACVAKPLAAGLPLGALLGREETAAALAPGLHGSTFGGGPLACRAALEFLDVVEEERLLDRVRETGGRALAALRGLAGRRRAIRDVRGRGLMIGIELDRPAAPVVEALLSRGFIVGSCRGQVLRLLPPFTIPPDILDRFASALGDLLNGEP
jgi:acetylornithine aminotransferase/acetylornithine/N-succinyldiaminopimelate aminotransferase